MRCRWAQCGLARAAHASMASGQPQPERLAPRSGHCSLAIMLAALSKGLVPVQAAAAAAALPAALQHCRRFAAEPAAAAETADGSITQVRGPLCSARSQLGWGARHRGATLAGVALPRLWAPPATAGRGRQGAQAPLQPQPAPPEPPLAQRGLPRLVAPRHPAASPISDCWRAGRRGGAGPTGGSAPPHAACRTRARHLHSTLALAGHRCRGGRAL